MVRGCVLPSIKKALQALGILFLIVVVVLVGLFGYAAYTGTRLDASSKKYVDSAVPAIVGHWSESELMARAAPELMQRSTPAQLNKLFGWLNRLGPMQKYCGSKGDSNVFFSPEHGKVISARYTVCAQFQNGNATIFVTLIRNKSKAWQIAGFRVNSDALVP